MTNAEIVTNVLMPIIVSIVSVFIALRLLPLDMQNKRSDTINKLFNTVDKLVSDLEEANAKILVLESKNEVTVRAELHIRLSDPPQIVESKVEYLVGNRELQASVPVK
jgi:hypothetical protein